MLKHMWLLVFLLAGLVGAESAPKVLFVVSGAHEMGGHPTGIWYEEYVTPYRKIRAAGFGIEVASPEGGSCVIDARSRPQEVVPGDEVALQRLQATLPLDQVKPHDYAAVYFPGGHGPMVDLAGDERVGQLVLEFAALKKPVAAVCHGPAAFLTAEGFVSGRHLTAFSNAEEEAGKLAEVVPFRLETELRDRGGLFESTDNFKPKVVVDGLLVTGQNPASSGPLAEALLHLLPSLQPANP